ncbi:hypothetical protein [Hymenobacter tenuis]
MEKVQTLVWILVVLAVFVWRMVQKAKATTAREQQERRFSRPDPSGKPRPIAPGLPATSFEELLRQMQNQNKSTPPASTPAPTFLPETTPAGRPMPQEKAPAARSLEMEQRNARSLERQATTARSLETTRKEARLASTLPRTTTQHRNEDYWSRPEAAAQSSTRATVADSLRNPASVRAAFVLSEILQRRF